MRLLKRGKDVIEVSEESAKMLLKVKPLEYKIIEPALVKAVEKENETLIQEDPVAIIKPVASRKRKV